MGSVAADKVDASSSTQAELIAILKALQHLQREMQNGRLQGAVSIYSDSAAAVMLCNLMARSAIFKYLLRDIFGQKLHLKILVHLQQNIGAKECRRHLEHMGYRTLLSCPQIQTDFI